MTRSPLSIVLVSITLLACSQKDDSATLPPDTALARELSEVATDTAAYLDAADVAMREVDDTALTVPPPTRRPSPAPTMRAPERVAEAPRPTPRAPVEELRLTACESPALADQRRCLLTYLARSDKGLDRTYQALIGELRRRAGGTEREPPTVQQLRTAQRAWLVYRDTECRRRNRGQEGPLWAPTRAKCLGEFSAQREEELAAQLAALR